MKKVIIALLLVIAVDAIGQESPEAQFKKIQDSVLTENVRTMLFLNKNKEKGTKKAQEILSKSRFYPAGDMSKYMHMFGIISAIDSVTGEVSITRESQSLHPRDIVLAYDNDGELIPLLITRRVMSDSVTVDVWATLVQQKNQLSPQYLRQKQMEKDQKEMVKMQRRAAMNQMLYGQYGNGYYTDITYPQPGGITASSRRPKAPNAIKDPTAAVYIASRN